MRCNKCNADVPTTARYCPNCAQPVIDDKDIKSSQEVSTEWVKTILEGQGYKIEIEENEPNVFIAFHDGKPNLFVKVI